MELQYEKQIKDILNETITKEIDTRIKQYPIHIKLDGKDVDIKSVDMEGGEINIEIYSIK